MKHKHLWKKGNINTTYHRTDQNYSVPVLNRSILKEKIPSALKSPDILTYFSLSLHLRSRHRLNYKISALQMGATPPYIMNLGPFSHLQWTTSQEKGNRYRKGVKA